MAVTPFGNSYAAQSLGLSANSTGAPDITQALKTQLAEEVKRRQRQRPGGVRTTGGAAALDLFGAQSPLGRV